MEKGPYKVSEVTRQVLLDAALEVFSSKGYAATRLEDIALQAGHTRGAISFHFKNKRTVYRTLVEQRMGVGRSTAEEHYQLEESVLKRIEVVIDDMVRDRVQTNKATKIFSSLMNERPTGLEDLADMVEDHFDYLIKAHARLVVEGQENGEIRQDIDPMLQAQSFYSFFWGVFENLNRFYKHYDEDAHKSYLKKILVEGLRA